MSVKSILMEEFNDELKELGKMTIGTDEYKVAVDGVTKLADRIIEIEKLQAERDDKSIDRETEIELKSRQLRDEKRDRIAKNCIAIGGAIFSAVVYGLAFVASTNFERDGTFTTEGGKSSIRQLLKLKS